MSEIITSIEAGRTRSWVDPIGAAELSSLVCRELRRKFLAIKERGGKVYFVTLTYDPDPWLPDGIAWKDATIGQRLQASESCWDAMTADRHVHNFISRLEAETGLDLSGRWWSKREFTKNGFLHHHLIIDGPDYLPFDQVYNCWGFGRIDAQVARTEEGLAWYVGKYCTKFGDEPPAWIYNRPAGSLRFTTCSDGWWSSLLGPVGAVRQRRAYGPRSHRSDRKEDKAFNCYETVGMRIARKGRSVTVRCNGEREEVQGVTLEEFRQYRDPSYARSVIKARRSMDAVVGLSLEQACRELRLVASYVRQVERSEDLANVGSAAAEQSAADPQLYPAVPLRPDSHGVSVPSPWRPSAVVAGSLVPHQKNHGYPSHSLADSRGESAARASRRERCVRQLHLYAACASVARGSLILSSPQECNEGEKGIAPVRYQGVPPDPLPLS